MRGFVARFATCGGVDGPEFAEFARGRDARNAGRGYTHGQTAYCLLPRPREGRTP